ncbi:hypothetical protein OEZ84_28485, partial [Leclercia adecarboxylata]|uniref:hypothetical protein n=1 Tax=Leclercia adecarboxylata TaxID=83655 RepID=UPI00234D08E6
MDQPFSAARSFDHALDILAFEAGELGFDAVDYGYLPQVRATDGGWVAATIVTRNVSANLMRDWPVVGRHDPYLCSSYERTLPLD